MGTRSARSSKAEAVLLAAQVLRDAQLHRPAAIRDAATDRLDTFRAAWREIPGQRSGLSLDYFLMLCGMPGSRATGSHAPERSSA